MGIFQTSTIDGRNSSLRTTGWAKTLSCLYRVNFCNVPKKLNRAAHSLAKVVLTHSNEVVWTDDFLEW